MYAKKNAREEEARKVINELLKDQTERIASELNENELENLFMHVQNEVRTFAFPPEAVGEEETWTAKLSASAESRSRSQLGLLPFLSVSITLAMPFRFSDVI